MDGRFRRSPQPRQKAKCKEAAQNPHSCDSSDLTGVDHSRTRTRCMTLYVPANIHLAAPKRIGPR